MHGKVKPSSWSLASKTLGLLNIKCPSLNVVLEKILNSFKTLQCSLGIVEIPLWRKGLNSTLALYFRAIKITEKEQLLCSYKKQIIATSWTTQLNNIILQYLAATQGNSLWWTAINEYFYYICYESNKIVRKN